MKGLTASGPGLSSTGSAAAAASGAGGGAAAARLGGLAAQAGALEALPKRSARAHWRGWRRCCRQLRPVLRCRSRRRSAAGARSGTGAQPRRPRRLRAAAAAMPAAEPRSGGRPPEPEVAAAAPAAAGALAPQRQAADRLRKAAALLAPHASLAATVQGMRAKAERLRSGRFTIALFGAFSAGKSSLANALIGEAALPVSPNPTTAAINRIVPPRRSGRTDTRGVWMKTRGGDGWTTPLFAAACSARKPRRLRRSRRCSRRP